MFFYWSGRWWSLFLLLSLGIGTHPFLKDVRHWTFLYYQVLRSPLIFRVRPPSQEVSEVRRGSGVLLLSRKTSIESMSTPRRSHTPEMASLRQVPLTAGTRSSHSSPHTSNTAVKNSVPDTFPAELSFRRRLRALLGTSSMSLSVSLELSMSSFAVTPMASRFVRLFERPWERVIKTWTSWACNKIIRHKTILGRSLLTAGVYHALLPSHFKLCYPDKIPKYKIQKKIFIFMQLILTFRLHREGIITSI